MKEQEAKRQRMVEEGQAQSLRGQRVAGNPPCVARIPISLFSKSLCAGSPPAVGRTGQWFPKSSCAGSYQPNYMRVNAWGQPGMRSTVDLRPKTQTFKREPKMRVTASRIAWMGRGERGCYGAVTELSFQSLGPSISQPSGQARSHALGAGSALRGPTRCREPPMRCQDPNLPGQRVGPAWNALHWETRFPSPEPWDFSAPAAPTSVKATDGSEGGEGSGGGGSGIISLKYFHFSTLYSISGTLYVLPRPAASLESPQPHLVAPDQAAGPPSRPWKRH